MTTIIRHTALAALLVLATALTGCVKFKQTTTVMPDGSGKIQISIGMSEQLVAMAKQQGEDPFADMDPRELADNSKGIVAFSKPVEKTEGGYTYLTFAAYFEDANGVELGSPEDGEDPITLAYERDGDAATLTVTGSMILSAVSEYEPMGEEEKAFAGQMLEGMSFTESYTLPGTFDDIKGVTAKDNTATIEMDGDDMIDGTGPIEELEGVEELVFKISDIKEDAAATKAFKEELEKAKKEWEEMQAD